MKSILTLALIFLTAGCTSTGYNPTHYILSDTLDEEATLSQEVGL